MRDRRVEAASGVLAVQGGSEGGGGGLVNKQARLFSVVFKKTCLFLKCILQ